jgi:transcription elongation factor Elf1
MRNCPNCGAQITCGCQDRTASDGKRVCSNCVAYYEQQLAAANQTQQNENTTGQ